MKTSCFIITLHPTSPKVGGLLDEFDQQGIEVNLFSAVDGRQGMPPLEPGEEIDQKKAILRNCAPLTSSEVGCYLSHYRLIKAAYDSGINQLCVFEDDIVLEDGLRDVLDEVYALSDEFELVRLMGLRVRERKVAGALPRGRLLVRPRRGLQGTQGYVLNRKGMEKILRNGRVLSLPIDIFYDTFWETDLKCYGIEPHMIYEHDLGSSITKSKQTGVRPAFLDRVRWHAGKTLKSVRRWGYLKKNSAEFSPSEKPEKKPGRTERMR